MRVLTRNPWWLAFGVVLGSTAVGMLFSIPADGQGLPNVCDSTSCTSTNGIFTNLNISGNANVGGTIDASVVVTQQLDASVANIGTLSVSGNENLAGTLDASVVVAQQFDGGTGNFGNLNVSVGSNLGGVTDAGTSLIGAGANKWQLIGAAASAPLMCNATGTSGMQFNSNMPTGSGTPAFYLLSSRSGSASDTDFILGNQGFNSLTIFGTGNVQTAGVVTSSSSAARSFGCTAAVSTCNYSAAATKTTAVGTAGDPTTLIGNTTVSGGRLTYASKTLDTCAAGIEGTIEFDVLSGVATTHATRMCLCRSDGASTYTWINIVDGTVGTSTTCAD